MGSYEKLSDNELAVLLKQKDHGAFTAIYNRYKGVLFIHALKLLKDEEEARDVIHELFTNLWDKSENLNFTVPLAAYLSRSVKNRIFDLFSHSKISADYIEMFHLTAERGEFITDEKIFEKELITAIHEGLTLLPEKMRQVFEMSRLQNMSHKEIAATLNISDKTVKTQVHNALKILRVKLSSLISLF